MALLCSHCAGYIVYVPVFLHLWNRSHANESFLSLFLGSYPFQDDDPFVIKSCPHLYFVGNQPEFGTRLIHGPQGQSVRLIAVPSFVETKEIVLVDMETLEVTKVKIDTV